MVGFRLTAAPAPFPLHFMNNLWRISKLAAQDKWRWIGAWTALLLSAGFFLAVPSLIGDAIDTAVPTDGSPPGRFWK